MKKAILISIKPKWVAKILNGKKTIEIRKTMPKCDLPIDVYIYCSKGNSTTINIETLLFGNPENAIRNGKVVAKFTLRKVEEVHCFNDYEGVALKSFYITDTVVAPEEFERMCCLTKEEIWQYAPYISYAWHIEDLVIFDEPKELKEFAQWGFSKYYYSNHDNESYLSWADKCERYHFGTEWGDYRGPQSWCYIEQEEE